MSDPGDQNVHKPPAPHCPDTMDMFSPRARSTDPDTSHAAAVSVADSAGGQRARCLAELARGPLTADEIDGRVGWRITSAGRRLSELLEIGLVRRLDSKRKTRSGRMARLWESV